MFSDQFSLRSGIATFNQFDRQGNIASISLGPPQCCQEDGSLLYLREDLLRKYLDMNDAVFVLVSWGERELRMVDYEYPDWAQSLYASHKHVWRQIDTLSKLSSE